MADRVYPSGKPQPPPLNGSNPAFPATKSQLYGASRPAYLPRPKPSRGGRGCWCRCCCWLVLLLLGIVLLLVIAGAVVWVLYRPQRPSFLISSLRISSFNLTSSQVNSLITLSFTARNPNKKLVYYYDPMAVSVASDGVDLADGTVPGFVHGTKNTTTVSVALSSAGARPVDSAAAGSLKSDLSKTGKLPLEITVATKVKAKMGGLKSNGIGIKVSCGGIEAAVPTGKSKAADAAASDVKCKVKLRMKIWKWQI